MRRKGKKWGGEELGITLFRMVNERGSQDAKSERITSSGNEELKEPQKKYP